MAVVVHDPERLAYAVGPPPPVIPYSVQIHEPAHLARTRISGGRHRVHGTVRSDGQPDSSARALLFDRNMDGPLATTRTGPDGQYAFEWIKPGIYHVVGTDLSDPPLHPDIVRVQSEPMP